jgi:hypothetical protein
MVLVYDLKMLDKENEIKTPSRNAYKNGEYARLTDQQRKAWDEVYDPIILQFKKRSPKGKLWHNGNTTVYIQEESIKTELYELQVKYEDPIKDINR